ncbi:putative calcineurin-like phosphoesterase domain, ApaH type, metallo-dependent phosphatase [Septoria linicola]|nr:putative calcineurin-like phosphoesterase domain, ApaH type, metallo-dependent phosphatase [Septoria linicola]
MRLRHVAQSSLGRITRRYPWLRHITLTTTFVTLLWLYFIHSRERSLFESHIQACDWQNWEPWHKGAQPHRSVFIADPQLVDPHTYPGRPWPLSSLTEYYTDLYMRRNFKLINQVLDPDSVVFLGDLFDGGREWSTEKARGLNADQRKVLINLLVLDEKKKEGQRLLGDGTTDLNKFVPGEKGRWNKWKQRQWDVEFDRFARIFLNEEQLYPAANRSFLPAWELPENTVSIENGAKNLSLEEYGSGGTKSRILKTSLPGNHDLGFGSGVQITVRDRFESRFGETNSVYVLGNHTFVSLDSPSLSAYDEYVADVGEVSEERRAKYSHLWKPTNEFLDSLDKRGPKTVAEELDRMFPGSRPRKLWSHELTEHKDDRTIGEKLKPAAGQLMKRGDENEWKLVPSPKKPAGPQLPVVLLSHVPLYRNPDVDCGKLRERGRSIPLSAGYQYQNVLTPTLTSIVAKKVSAAGDIVHVFSGDDHDYCDVTHRFNIGRYNDETKKEHAVMRTVREITVKSFSWAMGVRQPGFMLVSMWNPIDEKGKHIGECMGGMDSGCKTVQTELCLLPDQLSVFITYAQLLGLTILILFVRAVVIGIRNLPEPEEDDPQLDLNTVREKMGLPRFIPRGKPNGRNGSTSPRKSSPQPDDKSGRGRASSTSTGSANASSTSNQHLSVQRSYNARTRTVSPAANSGALTPNHSGYVLPNLYEANGKMNGGCGGLIEKAGYYPSMRWRDPDEDEESDEESHVGSHYGDLDDSQAKGGKAGRRKPKSRARRALDEFLRSVLFIAVPAGLWYGFLIKNG